MKTTRPEIPTVRITVYEDKIKKGNNRTLSVYNTTVDEVFDLIKKAIGEKADA